MTILSAILTPSNIVTTTNTVSLTNKTIAFGSNTFTGALAAANGGTGLTSPGTSGNVLTSNGTGWVSSTPAAGTAIGLVRAISINCILP